MPRDGLTKAALVAAIAVAATLVIACGNDDDDDGQTTGDGSGGVPEMTIATSASELKFAPSELTVKEGEPVRIVLDNEEGTVLHDWTIEEMEVANVHAEGGAEHMMDGEDMDDDHADDEDTPKNDDEMSNDDMQEMGGFALHIAADAGTKALIEFTPEEAGEYTFYCTVEGHRQAGMEGKLIVE